MHFVNLIKQRTHRAIFGNAVNDGADEGGEANLDEPWELFFGAEGKRVGDNDFCETRIG